MIKFKKDFFYWLLILTLVVSIVFLYNQGWTQGLGETSVFYNQRQPLNEKVIEVIQNAHSFVYFAIYTFTRQDILDALLGAKYRGLNVVGITDRSQYEQAPGQKKIIEQLRAAGIPVYEQTHEGIMHLKVLVTDKEYASGSYNWTTSATTINDEVLEVSKSPKLRTEYQNILEYLFQNNHKEE